MRLTGKQIIERGIVTNYSEEAVQQQGIDVRVWNIWEVGADGTSGLVPAHGKTMIPRTRPVYWLSNGMVTLEPGYYEIEFMEACEIPADCVLHYDTRSSLIRCGSQVRSGQFDGGFKTPNMGAYLKVEMPITIEREARLAQAVVDETYTVSEDDLYNGQFQNDSQRTN
jgi:deoxycytidine triphosphate deaminase